MTQLAVGSFVSYCQQTTGASYTHAVTAAAVAWAASGIDPTGATSGQLGPFGIPEYLARAKGLDLTHAEAYPHYFTIGAAMSRGWRDWGIFPVAWLPGQYDPTGHLRSPQSGSQAHDALATVKRVLAGGPDPRLGHRGLDVVRSSWRVPQRFVGGYASTTHGNLAAINNHLGRIPK